MVFLINKNARTWAFKSTFIRSSKDNVQTRLINTISGTLFNFLIPAATWIWGMYLSRSRKGKHANASYNVRNAAVCIVYVWMGGHQLLPGKQRLQSPRLGAYTIPDPAICRNLSKYWCGQGWLRSQVLRIQQAAVAEPQPAQLLGEGVHLVQALSSTGRTSSKSQRHEEPLVNRDKWAVILKNSNQQAFYHIF